MKTTIHYKSKVYCVDLSQPIDISIPVKDSKKSISAWSIKKPKIKPVQLGKWIGSIKQGAKVNFNSIKFSPHAHGTHTECVGHITKAFYSVNKQLQKYFFLAELISITPQKRKEDLVIFKTQLESALKNSDKPEAVIIKTQPNTIDKLNKQYTNTNPPYILEEAMIYLKDIGVKHLLIDLPSVDKEKDQGKLLAHNAFWNTVGKIRLDATITELIFVPDTLEDGKYILNLQVAAFDNNASPSRPVLYKPITHK